MGPMLKIGDVVPREPRLDPLGEPIHPIWLALTVPPRKDFASVEFLQRKGVRAFAPSHVKVRYRRGVRYEMELPVVRGIVYAKFRYAPQWDVLRFRGIITGVLARGGVPIVLRSSELMRLRGLPEAMRAMVARAQTVSVGDAYRLGRGPLAGYMVEVTEVRGGQALCEAMGVKVVVDVCDLLGDE